MNRLRGKLGSYSHLGPAHNKVKWHTRVGVDNLNQFTLEQAANLDRAGRKLLDGSAWQGFADLMGPGIGEAWRIRTDASFRFADKIGNAYTLLGPVGVAMEPTMHALGLDDRMQSDHLRAFFYKNPGVADLLTLTNTKVAYDKGMIYGGGKGANAAVANQALRVLKYGTYYFTAGAVSVDAGVGYTKNEGWNYQLGLSLAGDTAGVGYTFADGQGGSVDANVRESPLGGLSAGISYGEREGLTLSAGFDVGGVGVGLDYSRRNGFGVNANVSTKLGDAFKGSLGFGFSQYGPGGLQVGFDYTGNGKNVFEGGSIANHSGVTFDFSSISDVTANVRVAGGTLVRYDLKSGEYVVDVDAFDKGLYAQFTSAVDGDLPAGAKYDGFLPELYEGFEEVGKDVEVLARETGEKLANGLTRDINGEWGHFETDEEQDKRLHALAMKAFYERSRDDYMRLRAMDIQRELLEKGSYIDFDNGLRYYLDADGRTQIQQFNDYNSLVTDELCGVGGAILLARDKRFKAEAAMKDKIMASSGKEGYDEYLEGRCSFMAQIHGTVTKGLEGPGMMLDLMGLSGNPFDADQSVNEHLKGKSEEYKIGFLMTYGEYSSLTSYMELVTLGPAVLSGLRKGVKLLKNGKSLSGKLDDMLKKIGGPSGGGPVTKVGEHGKQIKLSGKMGESYDGAVRKVDLYDERTGRAIEVKNSASKDKVKLSSDIHKQINADVHLRLNSKGFYKPEWHFLKEPTEGLKKLLEAKKIPYIIYGR